MEDFASIIWILFLIGSFVISIANKRKRPTNGSDRPQSEAWPTADHREPEQAIPSLPIPRSFPPSAGTTRPKKTAPEVVPTPSTAPVFDIETPLGSEPETRTRQLREIGRFTTEFKHRNAPTKENRETPRTQQKPAKKEDRHQGTAPTAADTAETSKFAAEFDLRQAVIYSEILKPKFETYE